VYNHQRPDQLTETARRVRQAAERLDELLTVEAAVLGRVVAEGRTEPSAVEADFLDLLDRQARDVIAEVQRVAAASTLPPPRRCS
jgi:hypothetical protein